MGFSGQSAATDQRASIFLTVEIFDYLQQFRFSLIRLGFALVMPFLFLIQKPYGMAHVFSQSPEPGLSGHVKRHR